MPSQFVRRAAVAGSWYPGRAEALTAEVDRYLAAVEPVARLNSRALVAPHAGLMYSGHVAAYAYKTLLGRSFDVAVLVGPSHYVAFDGVAIWPRGAFETPYGPMVIAGEVAGAIAAASAAVIEHAAAHVREHSLEMQLPFLQRVLPGIAIVPLVMGHQTRATIMELGGALSTALEGRNALLIASTDLSHYYDRSTAATLDEKVIALVRELNPEGLIDALERFPHHACGGGPTASVMLAARALGLRQAAILKYGDSGDVSGDTGSVVGYLAAAFGTSPDEPGRAKAMDALGG